MKAKVSSPEAYRLLHMGAIALAQIESNGIRIDTEYLDRTMKELDTRIREKENKLRSDKVFLIWRKRFADKTKLGSHEQLGEVLFKLLKYPVTEKTESGRPSTDEATLAKIDSPFVKDWLQVAKLKKVNGTFLKGIKEETVDGYLHPVFNLHSVQTYRSSSDSPNFQNFPSRNPEATELIRKCFVPRKGRHLLEVDYSGIEVRIAYCHHKDPVMEKYLRDPTTDMHRDTAMQLFMLEKEQVERKTTRDWSKNRFVFPEFYGSVYFQCAPHLWEAVVKGVKLPNSEITVQEHLKSKGIKTLGKCDPKEKPKPGTFEHHVKTVEDSFWSERFKVYTEWKKRWWADYLKEGGFTTLTGFRINGVYKKNEVLNYSIQGCAFHCLLWSLIHIQKWLRKYKMKTLIVGQIHDSVILDVHPDELNDVLAMLKQIMTVDLLKAWKWIIIPLDVEAEITPINGSWYEKKGVALP